MAEKKYEVIVEKFVGKHKTYKKGETLFAIEIMGGESGRKLALEGQKGAKNKRQQSLPDIKPTLKVTTNTKAKK